MEVNANNQCFSLSVIIPTLNGARSLPELLAGLSIQTVLADEILVIDSQSSDNSVEIATAYGAQVTVIERAAFDHGATRTMAAIVGKRRYPCLFHPGCYPGESETPRTPYRAPDGKRLDCCQLWQTTAFI